MMRNGAIGWTLGAPRTLPRRIPVTVDPAISQQTVLLLLHTMTALLALELLHPYHLRRLPSATAAVSYTHLTLPTIYSV